MKSFSFLSLFFAVTLLLSSCGESKVVESGSTWTVDATTELSTLTIEEGATIEAPEGYSVSMTVDGVETGIAPGTYKDVILVKTTETLVPYSSFIHEFRQALYIDETGVADDKSVTAAAGDYSFSNGTLTGATVQSVGEAFNGIYAVGGTTTLKDVTVRLTGNGGNDFAGWGSGIMSSGKNTTLIVDGADIHNQGAIRTAVIGQDGSNLIVKNSTIVADGGTLPADYVSNVTPGEMKDCPWMLGIVGNNRATNLLGNDTHATYINSTLKAEGWGVLSIDDSQNTKLTAINDVVEITGPSGYGSYSIGNAHNSFYGTTFNVPDYSVIVTGGFLAYGASTPEKIAELNSDLDLHLSQDEMSALEQKETVVNSDRFGIMWHGQGTADITDATEFNCGETVFLVKGATAGITVDGSNGAKLNSGTGVIMQVMDNDDPGPVTIDGVMCNKGVYSDPTEAPVKDKDFDVYKVNDSDVTATFSDITLNGDFYNSITGSSTGGAVASGGEFFTTAEGGGAPGGDMPAGGGAPDMGGAPGGDMPDMGGAPGGDMPDMGGAPGGGGGASASGKNMVLTFENSSVTGVITASTAKHSKAEIASEDYKLLGEVTNTPCEVVNNGVIVSLDGSSWTVTGTSYISSLTISDDSSVEAPEGSQVTMTVNGVKKSISSGKSYKGNIVLTVN